MPWRCVWCLSSFMAVLTAANFWLGLLCGSPPVKADETIEVSCFERRGEWYVPAVQVFSNFSCRVWWKAGYSAVVLRRAVREAEAAGAGTYEWTAREVWATQLSAATRGPRWGPAYEYEGPPEGAEILWNACVVRDGTGFVALRRVCEALGLDVESTGGSSDGPPWEISGYVNKQSDVGDWAVGERQQGSEGLLVTVRLVRRTAWEEAPLPTEPEPSDVPGLSAMPAPGLGFPVITATNDTKYTLYLYLKGPEQHSWSMAPGESITETIEPGKYKYFATVKRQYVRPASGYYSFKEDVRYEWRFYIR
ncbi:MAG: hypothetical protein N2512_08535 [Armatimonadetes bacterium]|nr:hypothetical protein [Armatimonadota bacterium]